MYMERSAVNKNRGSALKTGRDGVCMQTSVRLGIRSHLGLSGICLEASGFLSPFDLYWLDCGAVILAGHVSSARVSTRMERDLIYLH